MVNNWVFWVAIAFMALGDLLYLNILRMQLKLYKVKILRPLKRLLISAVVFLIIGSLPLMYVYLNTVWLHERSIWIIYVAVIVNSISKVIVGLLLTGIYKIRIDDEM